MALLNVTRAELSKLLTLPLVPLTLIGTMLAGASIAIALATVETDQHVPASASAAVLQAVPFVQIGVILLGVLPVGHEYAGSQFRTTVAAVPRRGSLLAGKSAAALVTASLASLLTVAVSAVAAVIARRLSDMQATLPADELWTLAGASVYLALIGMLSYAVALLLRHLVPALVTTLALVLVIPPLLRAVTEHARWLPDQAGSLLYRPGVDTVLDAGTGSLVLVGWIIAVGAVGAVGLMRRDA